jgi:hypothetical protein
VALPIPCVAPQTKAWRPRSGWVAVVGAVAIRGG